MISAVCILLLLLGSGEDTGTDSAASWGVLLRGFGTMDLQSGLSTARADTLSAFPRVLYTGRNIHGEAAAEVDFRADSTGEAFKAAAAGCFFTWPGSPWISAGVFHGLRKPFISGIGTPGLEWDAVQVSDSTGVAMEAGGILGFDGFWNQYGDGMAWYGARSPWLGFGQASWERVEADSSGTDYIRGFADLRMVQPWFLLEESDTVSAGEIQLRGWRPDVSSSFRLEVIPGVRWKDDSTSVSLQGLVSGRSAAFAGSAGILVDTDSLGSATIRGGYYMLTRSGIQWDLNGELEGFEDFTGSLSGLYSASPAGFGGEVNLEDDSLSLTATGIYAPLPEVTSLLSVTADLDTESPDPRCRLLITGGSGRGLASLSVLWDGNETSLDLGVSAWID